MEVGKKMGFGEEKTRQLWKAGGGLGRRRAGMSPTSHLNEWNHIEYLVSCRIPRGNLAAPPEVLIQGMLSVLSYDMLGAERFLVVKKRGGVKSFTSGLLVIAVGLSLSTLVFAASSPEYAQDGTFMRATMSSGGGNAKLKATAELIPVPAAAVFDLVSVYISHSTYRNYSVACTPKLIDDRNIVRCSARNLRKDSQAHLWEYAGGKFTPINQVARILAEKQFAYETLIDLAPASASQDIDIASLEGSF